MEDSGSRHSRPVVDTRGMFLNTEGLEPACSGCGAEAKCENPTGDGYCRDCRASYPCCGTCCAAIEAMVRAHSKRHAGVKEASYLTEIETVR